VQDVLPRGNRYGSGEARITKVVLTDKNGKPEKLFKQGDSLKVIMDYETAQDLRELVFGVSIFAKDGTYCFGTNSRVDNITVPSKTGKGTVAISFDGISFTSGTYLLDVGIFDYTCSHPFDYLSRSFDFKIRGGKKGESGFFHLDHDWDVR
jgi:hypothetical protein